MNKTKIFIIIGTMTLIWLFLIYILLAKLKSNNSNVGNTATLTNVPTPNKPPNTPTPKRTYVTLANNQLLSNTGDANDAPPSEVTASAQRGKLLSSLPLKTAFFQVTMDYKRAKYVVAFADKENAENKSNFEKWLKENYPDVSIEEFVLD